VYDGASSVVSVDDAEAMRLPVGARRMRMSRGAMPNAAAFVANLRQPTTVRAESRTSCLELSRADFMHLLGDFDEIAAELKARVLQVSRVCDESGPLTGRPAGGDDPRSDASFCQRP